MTEPIHADLAHIPEELMLQRLAESEQLRDFFIQMWLENPALSRHAGDKIRALLSPLNRTLPDTAAQ